MIASENETSRGRLAILVVYIVDEEHQALHETHLRRIRRHTACEYTVYCAAVNVTPDVRTALDAAEDVTVVECAAFVEPAGLAYRRVREHSHYLDQLIARAVEDQPTHIVTLHTDSFPIRDDWVQVLSGMLSEERPLVTLDQDFTACLMMHRSLAETLRPSFLPTIEQVDSEAYGSFEREMKSRSAYHRPLSGTGYMFAVFELGQGWVTLRPEKAGTYAGVVFHLGGAIWRDIGAGSASTVRISTRNHLSPLLAKSAVLARFFGCALNAIAGQQPLMLSTKRRIREIIVGSERRAQLKRLTREDQ